MHIPAMLLVSSLAAVSSAAVSPSVGARAVLSRSQDPAPKTTPAPDAADDAALQRIQKKLMSDPAIKLDKQPIEGSRGRPAFRVRVDAPAMTVDQVFGPDFLKGPVPATGMTHQEFLDLVTPKDVRGYAAFTNEEGITVALTSTALQLALKQALEQWRRAKDERARQAARQEVEDAVAALRRARRDAGLPAR
jgi:hypothetical protein